MAGCRPEYMPVLIAGGQAFEDPASDLKVIGATTNPDGLITKSLEINS